jgi:hypothetical protein
MAKSRVVGQGFPSLAMPRGGIVSRPSAIALFAAPKNAGALQYANCPKTEVVLQEI